MEPRCVPAPPRKRKDLLSPQSPHYSTAQRATHAKMSAPEASSSRIALSGWVTVRTRRLAAFFQFMDNLLSIAHARDPSNIT